MKIRALIICLSLFGAWSAAVPAWAHDHGHGHHRHRPRIGVYFGPVWPGSFPPYVHYPHVYAPPVVVVRPAEPQVYIERATSPPAPQDEAVWYYCRGAQSYYPYVKECPGGWERVAPTPPPN